MNTKINNGFYNSEIKEEFLNSLDEVSRVFSTLLMKKSSKTEKVYERDLYDLTVDEIGEVAADLEGSSNTAVYANVLRIEEYIDWAIDNGYRKSNINPLSAIDKVEWSKQFVASYKNYYFTRENIESMCHELYNPSDKGVLLGLFEGIGGRGFSELLNLKEDDIREKNGTWKVRLKDDKNEEPRYIEISEMLAEILISSANRPTYFNRNGMSTGNRYEQSKFENSPFVFKKTKRGKSRDGGLDAGYVSRKFQLYKDVFNREYLKSKHIVDSGIMHMANELQVDGILTTEQLYKIGDHFNTRFTYGDGKLKQKKYRNVTVLKSIISIPEFKELYGYEMKYEHTYTQN